MLCHSLFKLFNSGIKEAEPHLFKRLLYSGSNRKGPKFKLVFKFKLPELELEGCLPLAPPTGRVTVTVTALQERWSPVCRRPYERRALIITAPSKCHCEHDA
jgi:hypothetical protein